jgi:hypothetical protein
MRRDMNSSEHALSGAEDGLETTDVRAVERRLTETRDTLDRVREEVSELRKLVLDLVAKTVTTCKKCGAAYDLFSHHYSIGLFDNIVYVKCPQCQTSMPVDPRHGVRKD